jgi:hypothetical protein
MTSGDDAATGAHPDDMGALLGELLSRSARLHPDDLADAFRDAAERAGATDVELLVVDLAQQSLLPLLPGDHRNSLPVVGSVAGDAYRQLSPIDVPTEGALRRWVPILDSAERVGVLGVTVPEGTPLQPWRQLASLAGELYVAKARYGDRLNLRRRTRSTTVAAEMRWALLPPLSFRSELLTISGILEPAYDIAGDTFDYSVNGDTAHLALLDAMGHGLEASRMANVAVTSYRHSRRSGLSLPDTATAMDAVVQECFEASRYVTGQLATLEISTGIFRMLNMGHPLPLLVRDGRVVGELPSDPMLPAGWGDKPAAIHERRLEPGDQVLMYTDGITEAKHRDGHQYGQQRLVDVVEAVLARGAPVEELLREIIEDVMAFQDFHARDDATLLVAGYRPHR